MFAQSQRLEYFLIDLWSCVLEITASGVELGRGECGSRWSHG